MLVEDGNAQVGLQQKPPETPQGVTTMTFPTPQRDLPKVIQAAGARQEGSGVFPSHG